MDIGYNLVMAKVGRPTTYTQELADEMCNQIAMGYSMRKVCEQKKMPAMSTFFKWIREHEEFSKQYARACEERTEAMAEDILDIADDGTNDTKVVTGKGGEEYEVTDNDVIQRSRLRVDTRKWLMSKMKPKKYGDKLDVTSGGEKVVPIMGGSSVSGNDSISEDSKS